MTEQDREISSLRNRLQSCQSAVRLALRHLEVVESIFARATTDMPLSTALSAAMRLRDIRRILLADEEVQP